RDDLEPSMSSNAIQHPAKPWRRIVAGGTLAVAALLAWLSRREPEDDVLIVYRYVARFVSHKGLTFNDGEYVEGYTSLCWTFLMSLGAFLHIPLDVVREVLVYASIALVIVAVRWLLGTLHVDLGVRHACLFLLITNFLYYRMCFLLPELALFSAF